MSYEIDLARSHPGISSARLLGMRIARIAAMRRKRFDGFTLVEIMIVVAIIALLAAISQCLDFFGRVNGRKTASVTTMNRRIGRRSIA
jgi:prepilin-type N-terminal cleavage/methylation domain-containing protein